MKLSPFLEPRILSVGDDHFLRILRDKVFASAKYQVKSLSSAELLAHDMADEFHIAVICRTVRPEVARIIAEKIRREQPGIVIIRLSATATAPSPPFDYVCDPSSGPRTLLTKIRELTAAPPKHPVSWAGWEATYSQSRRAS